MPILDANGNIQAGHYVSSGDALTVLDVGYTRQRVKLEYPTDNGVRVGYVANSDKIIYSGSKWHNGSTPEPVLDENGVKIGSLDPSAL